MTLENIVYACYEELEQPRPTRRAGLFKKTEKYGIIAL